MLSDIINLAIKSAQAVQLLSAAFNAEKDSRGLVASARSLLHSCELYEQALTALRSSVQKRAVALQDPKTVETLCIQIDSDNKLLQKILNEVQQLADKVGGDGTANRLRAAFKSAFGGGRERLKKLEDDLMTRVSMCTMLMMKDVWASSSGEEIKIFEEIGDTEGAMFWTTCFGALARSVAVRQFHDAYQQHIRKSLHFRALPDSAVHAIITHTLLPESLSSSSSAPNKNESSLITIQMYSEWLRRFGPFKDSLFKASSLINPNSGLPVSWFRRTADRDRAAHAVNAAQTGVLEGGKSLRAVDLVVLRYPRDPSAHFVATIKPIGVAVVQHVSIVNSALGYAVVGEKEKLYPTVQECVQKSILQPYFATAVKGSIQLPTEHITAWEELFETASAALPATHYADIDALKKAANEAAADAGKSITKSFFPIDESQTNHAATNSTTTVIGSNHESPSISPDWNECVLSSQNKSATGLYLIGQGLNLLKSANTLDENTVKEIISLINNRRK